MARNLQAFLINAAVKAAADAEAEVEVNAGSGAPRACIDRICRMMPESGYA